MYILGLESSCDETAASVLEKTGRLINVRSSIIASQIEVHRKYGGVVPEVAAREHVLAILPVINEALETADISSDDIDLIAVTKGPGLITSLIAGMETARSLAFAWEKPVLEINHVEAHIYSNFIEPQHPILLPAIILTVSGGHTGLFLMDKAGRTKLIGETLDDAAGEAYDKGAKMMGLPYHGGPQLAKEAEKFKKTGKTSQLVFPRPMLNGPSLDFSFSGLKTALLYQLRKDKDWKKRRPEYCFSYQEAIIDVLIGKATKALKKYPAKTLMLSGGVSANQELKSKMALSLAKSFPGVNFIFPPLKYTTDNAAMIAAAASFKLKTKKPLTFERLRVDPSLQLK